MVTHYGLFWSERDVFWGKSGPGGSGVLLGREKSQLARRGAPTKDERDNAKDYGKFAGIYCLYSGNDLIYAGQAGLRNKNNLLGRLKEHRVDDLADRWDRFSWFAVEQVPDKVDGKLALGHLEAVVIAMVNPGHNKRGGDFKDAVQVFQIPHEESDGDVETKLARLDAKLDDILGRLK